MAEPPPTRLHIEPPIDQWQITPRNGRTKPIIATGHQPTLWHPGILAKDLAADAIAQHVGGSALHVVVEHNAIDPISLDVPLQTGDALRAQRVLLERRHPGSLLPPNRLLPITQAAVAQQIDRASESSIALSTVLDGLTRIKQAYAAAGEHPHLAAQTTAVLNELKRPHLSAPMGGLPTSELVTPRFIDRLLRDPAGCARAYNRAAAAFPEARIRQLYEGRIAIEAPLWAQHEGRSRPVYIDIGDSRRPHLFTYTSTIDLSEPGAIEMLRPRAITLSAIMRSELCDLFIHGTGGGVYDQVTERWWHDWTGEELAPKAVVSADVYLPFEVPMATLSDHIKAQWFAHHLPHNLDRYAEEQGEKDAALSAEKRELLDRMNDDRDQRRRTKAFKRIHAINTELRHRHDTLIQSASRAAEVARVGVDNAGIACRRNWCFALYPDALLHGLRQAIDESIV